MVNQSRRNKKITGQGDVPQDMNKNDRHSNWGISSEDKCSNFAGRRSTGLIMRFASDREKVWGSRTHHRRLENVERDGQQRPVSPGSQYHIQDMNTA